MGKGKHPVIRLEGVGKSFPGVRALHDVNLFFTSGEVHAIVGENGAGKSTLMKILAGDLVKSDGRIFLHGLEEGLGSPRRAQELGIGMIHQELTLLPHRSIARNIMLGREPLRRSGLVDALRMEELARENIAKLGLDMDAGAMVSTLPIALRQMVEIAKAMSLNARVLILDEPTSSLTDTETRILLGLIKDLAAEGMTLIYISHRLEEVFEVSDRITVLRDGKLAGTGEAATMEPADVVRMMVGRELANMYPDRGKRMSIRSELPVVGPLLKVRGLSGRGFRDISLELLPGEVLGVSGLIGAGRTEFARALFGLDRIDSGSIEIAGKPVRKMTVRQAVNRGLVYVPEDRKTEGLFLNLSVRKNITLNALEGLSCLGVLNFRHLRDFSRSLIQKLNVRPTDEKVVTGYLSGGNQQKVVIARWLSLNPRILILDEPTRGVDVGAKAEIYGIIDGLAREGVGVIVISSETPEILGMSDRIIVMRDGCMVGELEGEKATQDGIMSRAAGVRST